MKDQWVRVVDVIIIGPAMIAAGAALTQERPLLSIFLCSTGGATIAYNGLNYIEARGGRNATDRSRAGAVNSRDLR
jgi:hypothetical protein